MNATEWMEKAREKLEVLAEFVETWHPVRNPSGESPKSMRITAPNPESASVVVRRQIASENKALSEPGRAFRDALERNDYDDAYSLLNSAWFGVPESTQCWNITGFPEAVALLEDPAEDEFDAS